MRSLVLGLMLAVLFEIGYIIVNGFSGQALTGFQGALVCTFILMLISRLLGKSRFTPQEISVIYAILLPTLGICLVISYTVWDSMLQNIDGFGSFIGLSDTLQPDFWAPKDPNILDQAKNGGVPVPWGAWSTSLGYWGSVYIVMMLLMIFGGTFMRRQVIEIERMPFPLLDPALEILKCHEAKSSEGFMPLFKQFSFKLILLGVIIGFVYEFLFVSSQLIPGFSPVSSTLELCWGPLGDALPMANLQISYSISTIAMGLLVPLDILFSIAVTFIIAFVIWPPITVSVFGQTFDRGWDSWLRSIIAWINPSPWRLYEWGYGALLGIGLVPFILGRKYFIESLKSIIKPSKEIEDKEAIGYRYIFIGIIILWLIYAALMLQSNVVIYHAITWPWVLLFTNFAMARIRGEVGGLFGMTFSGLGAHQCAYPMQFWIYPDGPEAANTVTGYTTAIMTTMTGAGDPWGETPMSPSLESYKLGSATKTRTRDIFLAQIIAVIVVVVTALAFYLYAMYTWGWSNKFTHSGGDHWSGFFYVQQACTYSWGGKYYNFEPNWPMIGIWVVITLVLSFLRLRFVWFPFNPIAIPFVINEFGFTVGWVWTYTLIIKYIVLKVGGTKAYSKYIVPLATGIIIGWAILQFVTGVILAMR